MPSMPRKAIPQEPAVQKIIDHIRGFCTRTNTCPLALSRAANVSQSSLFRFLDGDRKTVTPTARKVVSYINRQHNWHNLDNNDKMANHEVHDLIQDAAMTLWDGDRRSAEFLASLLRALKPAIELAIMATKDNPERG